VRPDGGIYQEEVKHYTTAVALLALVKSGDARYRPQIAAARDYLLGLQAREENGFPPSNPLHGGTLIGDGKANLDASFFAARAVKEAGLPRDHPYWARLIRFVSRCQNLKQTNDQPWAGSDGGFVFSPGFSFAGGTTSYGSMTYAGLSAYLDAGLTRADERVEAALRWLGARFTTRENPGLGSQTLFHSYFYMAHTLTRWRTPALVDGAGTSTPWRAELAQALHGRQRADGSWANEDPRWWESNPVLATAFAVRALKEAAAPAGD
jgi:squalene-hopene/tetraprenyl-beta-curcumene cyclase